MIDGAVLSGQMGGFTDWNAVRALKEHALNQQQQIANIHEADLQNHLSASAKAQEYLDAIDKAGLLDPDHKKVQAKELELRSVISDGIKKFGGDVDSYLNSGGLTELHDYLHDLTNSDEMKTGLMNYYHHNRYIADKNAGLVTRNTGYGKTGTYEENYQDYVNGKVPTLNYKGGFERPAIDLREEIGKSYGNANKTPQAANYYDAHNLVFTAAKAKGMSDADANQIAKEYAGVYGQQIKQGLSPYQFKSEDPYDAALKRAKLALINKKLAGGDEGLGDFYRGAHEFNINPSFMDTKNMTRQYQLPEAWSKAYQNVGGMSFEKPTKDNGYQTGILSNHDAFVKNNRVFIAGTNTPVDISSLEGGGKDYTLEPTNQLNFQNDQSGKTLNHGLVYRIHLTPSGEEKVKVNGKPLATAWGGKQDDVPGFAYKSGHWWNIGNGGSSGTLDVVPDFGTTVDPATGRELLNPAFVTALQQQTKTFSKGAYERNSSNIDDEEPTGYHNGGIANTETKDYSSYFSLQN